MSKTKDFLLTAGLVLATAFTFSCTSDIESAEDILGKLESSSSSAEPSGTVFCLLQNGGCEPIPLDICNLWEGTPVQSCGTVSSSSAVPLSSSVVPPPGSSSSVPSSSATLPLSSGVVVVQSSSSAMLPPSSSSGPVECIYPPGDPRCAGEQPSSSSMQSSSSQQPSSSSAVLPSSSATPSSSSAVDVGLCAGFVNGTPMLHYGKEKEQFCDERDGKRYVYVVIGTQTWMAENLNYDPGTGNSACYSNQASYCNTYGRLYDWATAMALPSSCNSSTCSGEHKGICPAGWHIPSQAEWDTLSSYVQSDSGCSSCDTKLLLKAMGNNGNATDQYGFSALLGGGSYSEGSFFSVSIYGSWWSTNEGSSGSAYGRGMTFDIEYAAWDHHAKSYLFSVRCIKD